MATDNNVPETKSDIPPLVRLSAAFLLAAGLFGVAAIVAFGTYGGKSPYFWGFTVFAGLSLGAYFLGRSQAEKLPSDKYSRQRTMLGINAVSTVLLFLVLLVGVNYIATRRHKTFDLTKNGANSLSEQTIKALGELKEPVRFRLFFFQRVDPSTESLLRSYESISDKVKYDPVNALSVPAEVPQTFRGQPLLVVLKDTGKSKGANPFGTTSAADRQEVEVVDEQNVTSAILKLQDTKPRKVYFLTGHGELDAQSTAIAKSSLEAQNTTVEPLSIIGGKKVPADANAVIVLGPQADLSAAELKSLQNYFNNKGHLVIFLTLVQQNLPNWNKLIASVGIQHGPGLMVTESRETGGASVGIKGDGTSHPVLRGLTADAVFPGMVPLKIASPAPAGVNVQPVFPAAAGVGTIGLTSVQPEPTEGLVYTATAEKGESRALVGGNANFAANRTEPTGPDYISQYGNRSFLLSAVNWAIGNASLVSIPPKTPTESTLSMPLPTARFASLFSVLVLPVLILAAGTFVWWRRR